MKLSTKAIFLIIGVFLTLLGGYLTWTALYPGTGEFQELSVPDYISGNSIKVSVHYPLRVLIGKSSQVRVKFSAGEGLIPGSALDQELDLPSLSPLKTSDDLRERWQKEAASGRLPDDTCRNCVHNSERPRDVRHQPNHQASFMIKCACLAWNT